MVRRISKWLFCIGIVLVVVGAWKYVSAWMWFKTRTFLPVNQDISLAIGHIETPEFTVNLDEEFALDLVVDHSVPGELQVNPLGIGDPLASSRTEPKGFKLAWAVESEGRVVEHGISDGKDQGYWADTIGRRLGFFRAQTHKPYKVKIDVVEDGSKLVPYHPRLQVRMDMSTLEYYFDSSAIKQFFDMGIVALGFLSLMVSWFLHWRSKKQPARPYAPLAS